MMHLSQSSRHLFKIRYPTSADFVCQLDHWKLLFKWKLIETWRAQQTEYEMFGPSKPFDDKYTPVDCNGTHCHLLLNNSWPGMLFALDEYLWEISQRYSPEAKIINGHIQLKSEVYIHLSQIHLNSVSQFLTFNPSKHLDPHFILRMWNVRIIVERMIYFSFHFFLSVYIHSISISLPLHFLTWVKRFG